MNRTRPWPLRILKILALALLALIVLLPLCLWLDHLRETTLPPPSGAFAVSRTIQVWESATERDAFAPGAEVPRRLIAWIWYPAVRDATSSGRLDYLPGDWRSATERQRGVFVNSLLTRDLSRVQSHSLERAALVAQPQRLPVVILRAGLSAQTSQYSSLAEDLASHGFIVVGFDAPYRTIVVVLQNGEVVLRSPANNVESVSGKQQDELLQRLQDGWSSDISFALDRLRQLNEAGSGDGFSGRLDLDRVGLVGHSLGGATAAQFCHDDARCKVGVDIDGALRGVVIRDGIDPPFLFLAADHRGEQGPVLDEIQGDIRAARETKPAGKMVIELRGANHFGFSDDGAILKIPGLRGALNVLGGPGMPGPRQLELTKRVVRSFLELHLIGAPRSSFNPVLAEPEVSEPTWARRG